jgi:hypothetical protein
VITFGTANLLAFVATVCRICVHWSPFEGFKLIEIHSDNMRGAS